MDEMIRHRLGFHWTSFFFLGICWICKEGGMHISNLSRPPSLAQDGACDGKGQQMAFHIGSGLKVSLENLVFSFLNLSFPLSSFPSFPFPGVHLRRMYLLVFGVVQVQGCSREFQDRYGTSGLCGQWLLILFPTKIGAHGPRDAEIGSKD